MNQDDKPKSPNRPDSRVYEPASLKKAKEMAEKSTIMTEQQARARLARLQREGKN